MTTGETVWKEALEKGVELCDRTGTEIVFRYLAESDDLELITSMLHEAYGRLATAGMNYVASHQDVDIARRRAAKGETIVAFEEGLIVGVVTLSTVASTKGCPFYDRTDVASFGQFAVRTARQGRGIGSLLIHLLEQRARENGVNELALDTSENATDLIQMYEAKGYRFIEYADWEVTNYRSLILSKRLSAL